MILAWLCRIIEQKLVSFYYALGLNYYGKSVAHVSSISPSILNRFPWNFAQVIFKSNPTIEQYFKVKLFIM